MSRRLKHPRSVFVVWEPPRYGAAVPYGLQLLAGFSHVKVVVMYDQSEELDESSRGKVFGFWKEGKDSIGHASGAFNGLQYGESYEHLTMTEVRTAKIMKIGMLLNMSNLYFFELA
jgi:hypothetical protein